MMALGDCKNMHNAMTKWKSSLDISLHFAKEGFIKLWLYAQIVVILGNNCLAL